MSYVLLIEPDKQLAEAVKKYFQAAHISVVISHSAQEAIYEADKMKPDLVILELAVPQNNGVAFLQEFRSYVDWMSVPVIVYSQISQADTGVKETDWQKYGIESYLYKPTSSLADLLNNVKVNSGGPDAIQR